MDDLEFEEKLEIKQVVKQRIFFEKKDKEEEEKKINLLNGSLTIEDRKIIEKLLKDVKYFYKGERSLKEKEASCFCIGKAIIVLEEDRKTFLNFISLEDFEYGINEYKRITGELLNELMKQDFEIKENFDKLKSEFLKLGKWDKIEKGRVLEEIDGVLTEHKKLGKKEDVWESLGITSPQKSMLWKRYNLFNYFEEDETFLGEEYYRRAIEEMIDKDLKQITKEGVSDDEKKEMILKEILKKKEGIK